MKMSTEVKEHIAGMIFYSVLLPPIACLIFMIVPFLVKGCSGFQEYISEYVIMSAISTLGSLYQAT